MGRKKAPAREHSFSPEVEWYLESRGYEVPAVIPKFHTPEPRNVPGARFDPSLVDKKIAALKVLRHTKGKWAGRPLEPSAVQVAYIIAPIFGWVRPVKDSETGETRWARITRDAYIEMPRKGAKALDVETPILTPDGWKTMGTLEVGDYVYGPDGLPTRVTHVSEVFPDNECFRVTTADGRSVIADADHLWTVQHKTKRGEGWKTITTEQLAAQSRRQYLPQQKAVHMSDRELPIEPYMLGVWLGDGESRGARISIGFADLEQMAPNLPPHTLARHLTCWSAYIPGLKPKLKQLDLIQNKHIPEEYLIAGDDQRLALLQGLMDSDGTMNDRGYASFCSIKRELAEQVLYLARSLGFRATLISGQAKLRGRVVSDSYRVRFFVTVNDPAPFRMKRKRDLIDKPGIRRRRTFVREVVPVPRRATRCIKVEREDGLFLAGEGLMATHNTTLTAGLAMLLAFADGEGGAEVLLGAASRDQARQAFDPLKAVANGSEKLKQAGVVALRSEIVQRKKSCAVKVVSSRGDLSHGANVHGGLIDELHVHKNPDLLEAIESGTGAREQPLVFIITTADDGQTTSVYAQRRDMIEKLSKRVLKAPTMYGVVFAADDDDDPFQESTWAKANPLYPITPSKEYMESAADKARVNPVQMASFQRLHLGIRSSLASTYFDLGKWDANISFPEEHRLKGMEAFGGMDLGSVSDVTALVWLVRDPDKEGYDVVSRFWVPEASVASLDKATANTASLWVKEKWLTVTPGDVTDYDFIEKQIREDAEFFNVVGLGYDRWNSSQLVINLTNDELPMEKVGQGYASMSGPLKEIDRLVRLGKPGRPLFRHGGNPVLRWMADNMRPSMDAAGNVKPDKSKSMNKIDGITAATIAMFVAMNTEALVQSAYETGKVETL